MIDEEIELLKLIFSLASAESLSIHSLLTICSQKCDIFILRVSSKSQLLPHCKNASKIYHHRLSFIKADPTISSSTDKQKTKRQASVFSHNLCEKQAPPDLLPFNSHQSCYDSAAAPFRSLYLNKRWGYLLKSSTYHFTLPARWVKWGECLKRNLWTFCPHHTQIISWLANCQLQHTQFPEEPLSFLSGNVCIRESYESVTFFTYSQHSLAEWVHERTVRVSRIYSQT